MDSLYENYVLITLIVLVFGWIWNRVRLIGAETRVAIMDARVKDLIEKVKIIDYKLVEDDDPEKSITRRANPKWKSFYEDNLWKINETDKF